MPQWIAGAFSRSCDGEHICGDATVIVRLEGGLLLAVIDGMGHGLAAHKVSAFAEKWLIERAHSDVAGIVDGLSEQLRGTEGGSVGICYVHHADGHVVYAGIGNTVLRIFGGSVERRLVSRDGVAGRTNVRAKSYAASLHAGDLLLLYSDGVRAHFPRDEIEVVRAAEPPLIARNVVLRFGKTHDDAACIAARWEANPFDDSSGLAG